jgi:hypothetical protein
MSVSQPVEVNLSQLPKPGEQMIEHSPFAQLPLPFAELQIFPHVPQFALSLIS